MFWRMLLRAAFVRRGRSLSALLAMVVAAAVATTMLNLYVDVQAKLRKEFRNYGANAIVVAKDGESLPANALQKVNATLAGRGLAVPFSYVVAHTTDGQSIVVSGTDFDKVAQLDRWWSVTAWPSSAYEALIGVRAASAVSPKGQPFDVTFQGRAIHLNPTGTVRTGASEDSRIYISSTDFEQWTNLAPSTIEVAIPGPPEEVSATLQKLGQALPSADARSIRQVVEGEARVLGKTRSTLLASAVLIIFTAALCVLSTLIGLVFDRRRDFAIMKALGASERLLNAFFAAEAALLGIAGAVIGFAIGIASAAWIGRVNFHAPVTPRFSLFPAVLAGSVAVALLSALIPMSLLKRVQPAMILRGE